MRRDDRVSFFPDSAQIVVAHRGLALDSPENTIPAFAEALRVGADVLETDVHASADGEAMVSHDPDLMRAAGRPDRVSSLRHRELSRIDLGGATMPTLAELLEEFPEAKWSVDIKHPSALEPVVSTLLRARATSRVMIATFSSTTRAQALKALSPIINCATSQQVLPAYIASRVGLPGVAHRSLAGAQAVFIPPRWRGLNLITPRFVTALSRQQVTLGVWTINDPDLMKDYWARGVRAMVTDRADVAVEMRRTLS
jgi:glycerophosphoryl diester phosphodiesterase